tara:strand:+ start:235 stop:912 length:678 start_codon:yes stop_codon:yes gene_type:complete
MKKTILIADDEKDILDLLSYNLEKHNFNVIKASDGSEALLKVNSNVDLIILDIMMPKLNGYELCDIIKKEPTTSHIPIIFLTAKSTDDDEYLGLIKGATDYIKKPISIKSLLVRIKNILSSKSDKSKLNVVEFKDIRFDKEKMIFFLNGKKLTLTKTEFKLLALFIKSPGKVFKREELLDRVWGQDLIVSDRTVDVHITKLRKKIKLSNAAILTSHGMGYFFESK